MIQKVKLNKQLVTIRKTISLGNVGLEPIVLFEMNRRYRELELEFKNLTIKIK